MQCMIYFERKLSIEGYHMRQPFFSVRDHMTSPNNAKSIGMVHIKGKLLAADLQRKYDLANDLKTKCSVLEHLYIARKLSTYGYHM